MSVTAQVEANAKAARLREVAREHKRAESDHRRRARKAMRALDQFVRECRENGIEVILEPTPTPTQPRRQSGYSNRPAED